MGVQVGDAKTLPQALEGLEDSAGQQRSSVL